MLQHLLKQNHFPSTLKLLLVLLGLLSANAATNSDIFICSPELPHLSVGNFNLTESNLEKVLNSDEIVAIVLTANWFQASCKYEPFWKELQNQVLSKANIKLARVDYGASRWVTGYIKIERVPLIVFAKKKTFYIYNSILDTNRIQNYLNNILQPLAELSTLEEAESFFALEKMDSQGRPIRSVKVLGIFYDLEEMDEEIEDFKNAARQLINRPEIYFAILKSPLEIKNARKKYQEDWFEDYSLSTIVIQKIPGKYTKIDLSERRIQTLHEILKFKALPLVQEYNLQNHEDYQKINLPMLVGIVDSAYEPNKFREFVLMLEQVALNYTDKVHVTWVDGVFNKNKRKMLGIEHDKLPTLAFNLILDPKNNTLAYPQEWEINEEKISNFVNDYITYNLFDLKVIYGQEKKVEKSIIYNLLTHVKVFGSNNITSYFNKRKRTDFILLIFNSQQHKNLENSAKIFNHVSRRFQVLQAKKIEFGIYDTFYFDLPEDYEYLKTPSIAIITSNHREKPISIPTNIDPQQLMETIQKNASFKFYLPEYPHISEEALEDFYREFIEKGIIPDSKAFLKL